MNSKWVYILWLFLGCFACSRGQALSDLHSPRIGDQFFKNVATYKHFPLSNKHDNVWCINDIEMLERTVAVEYVVDTQNANGLIGIENDTRYSYLAKGTEFALRAYENNLTKVVYDAPELAFSSCMDLGYQQESTFDGDCMYSEKVFSHINGQYRYEVDGNGCLLLPSGDTLRNVSRIHIQKYTNQIYDNMKQDSCVVESNTYRWYASGYRYPVYETQESHVVGNADGFKVAYYFSPKSQELLDDQDNECLRNSQFKENIQTLNENVVAFTKSQKLPDGKILTYSLTKNSGGEISVSLTCTGKKNVALAIYTLGGITVGKASFKDVDMGAIVWHQKLDGNGSVVYLLSVTVDGQTFTEKFINNAET